MAKPVTLRITVVGAFTSCSPNSAVAIREFIFWYMAVANKVSSPVLLLWKTIDFAILPIFLIKIFSSGKGSFYCDSANISIDSLSITSAYFTRFRLYSSLPH